jgi:hypothetical protein
MRFAMIRRLVPIPSASVAPRQRGFALRAPALVLAALAVCCGSHAARVTSVEEDVTASGRARVDDGSSHVAATPRQRAQALQATKPGFMPAGDPNAGTQGVFGPVLSWPLMPIHQILLPDGRVLTYGSDITGKQGGGLHYMVWDPTLGTGPDAFLVLPTQSGSNIFCAGQTLLPSGDALIVGGTIIQNKLRGIGIADVNVFDPAANALALQAPMAYRRWYPTLLSLADGRQLVMGGRMDPPKSGGDLSTESAAKTAASGATYASTPEIWSASTGWQTMTGAASDTVFGKSDTQWYYPRAWVAPNSKVFVLSNSGAMWQMNPDGLGTLTKLKGTVNSSNARLQSVMYQPGRILTIRDGQQTATIDINADTPVIANTSPALRYRQYGNATLLADGQVWLSGGSTDGNVTTGDWFVSESWDPATGQWHDMASATIARLYHSSALLLPDATVITGGGGDPGPFTNLNAEIFYPPYLYLKDGSGNLAPRPAITSAPDVLGWAQPFNVGVSSATPVSRVTLIRTGVVTHDFNSNQRFQDLGFTQQDSQLSLTTPPSAGIAPPGYYMLFVFDGSGVPSVAKILRIGT